MWVDNYAGPMTKGAWAEPFDKHASSPEQVDSEENQLLVGLPYVGLVLKTLADLNTGAVPSGILAKEIDRSDSLGLARLELGGVLDPGFRAGMAENRSPLERWYEPDTVGIILDAIKKEIRASAGGWAPTVGRNRLVGHVTATDGRVITALGDPEEVSADDIPALADLGDAGRNVCVGIADTPLRHHSWLEGASLSPNNPQKLPKDARNTFRSAHATFVTGLVLSQAPGARVQANPVLNNDGAASSWDVANGIVEMGRSGIDILNLSFAAYTEDAEPPLALATAIDRLDPDIVVVAAAGNNGHRTEPVRTRTGQQINLSVAPAWPAALDDVVCVGSTTMNSATRTMERSIFCPEAPWVDLYAPGDPVVSTLIGGLCGLPEDPVFARWIGTSFATALVTGAIAARTKPGDKTARQAWSEIRDHHVDGSGFLDLSLLRLLMQV